MPQAPTTQERKVNEVLMRALNREISWIQAAEIMGCTTRSLRRWKLRYQKPPGSCSTPSSRPRRPR
jgi:hypothetical protein